ncbi:alpha/beta hydrolase [Octadecabacter sp. R77987]|uniref:alpha/beta hydrolase n=1 Tax=Octadecabacter sp. R77987 TaxID=3093874 RepID=UPI00366DB207
MELDDAYANGAYIAGGDKFPDRWAGAAAAFRDAAQCELDQPYGGRAREDYDLFLPVGAPKGVVIFVHGGYWMAFDKSWWSHLAAGPLARGWAVAIPSYDLCPDITIAGITRQIAAVVDTVAARFAGLPLRLTGHSAGGHLVARMGCADVSLAARHRIARIVPVSPLGDLEPLLRTSMNETLQLDAAEARAESPVLHRAPDAPVTVWVGADERPAFIAQAQGLARAWQGDLVIEPARHHFDVIDGLADPDSNLVAALLG